MGSCLKQAMHYQGYSSMGHMEKQEMEMKWKLKMETGNRNWKRKWEQKAHQSLVQCFLHSVKSHYSCTIYLAMVMELVL